MKQYKRSLIVTALVGLLCTVGCSSNQSGHVAATALGDITHPAQRGSPIDTLDGACGATGALVGNASARIIREPYLQQMTSTSVIVGWLSTTGADERIDVTSPDGTTVVTAKGIVDRTVRATGDKQMWAKVTGLAPDKVYCYSLESGTTSLSTRNGFRTAPTSKAAGTVRFIAFGDSGGGGADQFALLEQMRTVPYDLMIHTGDLAYDMGSLAQFEDTVFAVYADLFRHIPFFPCAGNHDYETMQGAPFRDVFNLPDACHEKWYSYDYGDVHFAALDTEASYATQAAWLARDLAASRQPWKIVYMHRPPYSSGEHGSDMRLRAALAPVIEKYGVQLVLAGHDHDYERMTPQNGVQYIVTGGGGVGTRPVGQSSFTAFAADVIHFVYVEVQADQLVVHAIDGTGTEFDSVVVPRTH